MEVSILNGVRVSPSLDEDWSDYKVHFSTELDIDVPHGQRRYSTIATHRKCFHTSWKPYFTFLDRLDEYCVTLAHKANHSFTPNTKWGRLDHPQFGFVVTILATRCRALGDGDDDFHSNTHEHLPDKTLHINPKETQHCC